MPGCSGGSLMRHPMKSSANRPVHTLAGRSRIGRLAGIWICMLAASLAQAQLPSGTILGVIKDASGAVVPAATVTARNTETGQSRSVVTEADGSYRFNALPVGNYEIQVAAKGFQAASYSGLVLT